jgi:RHS repeat-associated protein
VAQTPESFQYDSDGNLTQDGRFDYTWNGENRLIKAETRDDIPAAVPRVTVEYAYDHQGRMAWKQISTNAVIVSTRTLFWDGYNIVQELTHSQTHTLTNSFLWGLDLSGTLQGAGGIGGLLAEVKDGVPYFAAYDANGNVTAYIATNGTLAAHYEFSPFGEIVVQSGDMADSFTHRFSTKPWCAVTGLSEYEKRKYLPGLGRWMSRDPIGESFDSNVLVFLRNAVVDAFDYLGNLTLKPDDDPNSPPGLCGKMDTYVKFYVPEGYKGFIIQHVKKTVIITEQGVYGEGPSCSCCEQVESPKEEPVLDGDFYEVFTVSGILPGDPGKDGAVSVDLSSGYGAGKCKAGTVVTQKTAVWFGEMEMNPDGKCPKGFQWDPEKKLCVRYNSPPPGWENRLGAPSLVVKFSFKGSWDCCPDLNGTTKVTFSNE